MELKEVAEKLNLKLKKDIIKNEIEKNKPALKYLSRSNQKLSKKQEEAVALATLYGRPIDVITMHQTRSVYQIGANLGKAVIVRYFYE